MVVGVLPEEVFVKVDKLPVITVVPVQPQAGFGIENGVVSTFDLRVEVQRLASQGSCQIPVLLRPLVVQLRQNEGSFCAGIGVVELAFQLALRGQKISLGKKAYILHHIVNAGKPLPIRQ